MTDDIIDTTVLDCDPEVAVVLPCHNEVDIIEKVVREFYEELNGKVSFEIVVCEDGARDSLHWNTMVLAFIESLGLPSVKVINLFRAFFSATCIFIAFLVIKDRLIEIIGKRTKKA